MRASIISLAAGLALLASGAASAQVYVGAAVGRGHIGVDCSDTTSCDTSSGGSKLYGGYLISKDLGVELGYFDWGKAKATGTVAAVGTRVLPLAAAPATLSGSLKASGFGLGVAYMPPLSGDWTAGLRAGVVWNKGKGTVDGVGSVSETSAQPYLGLGAGYKLSPQLAVTGELDLSRAKWGAGLGSDPVRLISIGLRYAF